MERNPNSPKKGGFRRDAAAFDKYLAAQKTQSFSGARA
jgi:hypothetical protein